MSREDIRQAFKTAIQSVFNGPIYTSRLTDNREDAQYISIFIEEGDIRHNFSNIETTAQITIRYCKRQPSLDSDLDAVVDPIIQMIPTHQAIIDAVKRPLLERFVYEPDGTHNGVNHTFKVFY